jgi:hypothetical protein
VVDRVEWVRHLQDIDIERLRALMEPIRQDEPVLQQMWVIFERVLDRAYAAAVDCSPGTAKVPHYGLQF